MFANKFLLGAITLVLVVGTIAQSPSKNVDERVLQRRINKQILVSELENRIRELSLAAPRVMARTKIAGWLWNDEKDDIGRAEEFAVAAVDDLYKNRTEVPPVYFSVLSSDIFALLEKHSPRTATDLKARYKVTGAEGEGVQNQTLSDALAERSAVDSAIRSLSSDKSNDLQLPVILHRLQERNSQERFRLLAAIIASEERIPGRLPLSTLLSVSGFYSDIRVPTGTAERFGRIVVGRTQLASQMPFGDFDGWLQLLNVNAPMIRERVPALMQDADVLDAVLTSRLSQKSRADRERNERINASINKIRTLIEEAEMAENPILKYDLYRRAARAALEKNLFRQAADLTLLFGAVDVSSEPILLTTQKNEVGQMLENITEKTLKAGDDSSTLYAVDKHPENERKAEGYTKLANFYIEKGDMVRARDAANSGLKLAALVESLPRRASIYLKLIPVTHRIDPTSVYEVNSLAARSINSIASPRVELKDDIESHRNYVTSLMIANWHLVPMLKDYVKTNKNGAGDLSGRIEKREVKVFADFIMGVSALDDAEVPASKKDSTERPPKS